MWKPSLWCETDCVYACISVWSGYHSLCLSPVTESAKVGSQGEKEQRGRTKTWKQEQEQIQEHSPLWVVHLFWIKINKSTFIKSSTKYVSLLSHHVRFLTACFLPQVNDTRVILQDADPNIVGSDYINANYVKVSQQTQKQTIIILISDVVISLRWWWCVDHVCVLILCFAEHPVGVPGPESLHCHSGMLSNNCQRFLADGMAGEHKCDRHDNKRGRERAG